MIPPDLQSHLESFWPTSVGGWVGLFAGSTALTLLIVDRLTARGKNLATIDRKIDGLCEQIEEMEAVSEVVDGLSSSIRDLLVEWQGRSGDNGYRSIIRENQRRITDIEKRNWQLDAVRQEDERRSGGQHRRAMDREMDRSLPEDREEKG